MSAPFMFPRTMGVSVGAQKCVWLCHHAAGAPSFNATKRCGALSLGWGWWWWWRRRRFLSLYQTVWVACWKRHKPFCLVKKQEEGFASSAQLLLMSLLLLLLECECVSVAEVVWVRVWREDPEGKLLMPQLLYSRKQAPAWIPMRDDEGGRGVRDHW